MGEYIRQEKHDEKIDQEYNRDYVMMRSMEDVSMKVVNTFVAAIGER